MAVFTVATSIGDYGEKRILYPEKENLRSLLYYSYNKCQRMIIGNLYPLGLECMFHQMCYLQNRRVKPLKTRALHYILSFDSQGYESDIDVEQAYGIMLLLSSVLFIGHQHIFFLHVDRLTHLHIHMVVNPVHMETLQVYNKSAFQVGREIMYWLAGCYQMPLQNFSYRNMKGEVVRGNEIGSDLYQDKALKKWGIKLPKNML